MAEAEVNLPEFPLVLIEWVDSCRCASAWGMLSDLPAPYINRCVTVGYVVAENENAKTLVPTIGDVGAGKDDQQICGGMMIPLKAILSERKLICRAS